MEKKNLTISIQELVNDNNVLTDRLQYADKNVEGYYLENLELKEKLKPTRFSRTAKGVMYSVVGVLLGWLGATWFHIGLTTL